MSRVGHHDRQVFLGDVRREAQQEAFGVGGGEADADVLGYGGPPRTHEVVLDHRGGGAC
jgi:hypothetical protein